jgi:PAS domain S-box-containing protein/putative nucleotidyltransferase with HDIG domain
MDREQIMSVLYDITLVIGGEVKLRPLLTKTLQRLLYHTSYPTGLVFLEVPESTNGVVEVPLYVAIGDFGFASLVGQRVVLPAELLRGGPETREAPELLASLKVATRAYGVFLRLPIDEHGVIVLLAPRRPSTQLPLTEIFRPAMANLAKAIKLCHDSEAYAARLEDERDQAKQSHAESEEKFHKMATVAQDAIILIDDQGRIGYWNPAAESFFGYRAQDVIGQDAHSLIAPPRYRAAFQAGFERFLRDGAGPVVGKTVEIEGLRKDGGEFPVELSISGMFLKGRWHAVGLLRDISGRRESEHALKRAHRALKTLSGCNGILVRAREEQHLLDDLCQLIVDTGGYPGARVGLSAVVGVSQVLRVASSGVLGAEMDEIEHILAERAGGMGPAARAFQTGAIQVDHDIAGPVGDIAHRAGFASMIALPLLDGDRAFGFLQVYAAEPDAFHENETALIQELSEDLAFGILTLRSRRERERLEAAEHESAERLKRALLGTIQAVALTVEKRDPYTAGHQQKVARLAVAIAEELGWPPDRIEGVRLGGMIHDIGKIYVPAEILNRPGRLSKLEFGLIMSHPEVGYEILKDVELPWPVAQIILQHHERLDGSGYPMGLKGSEIIDEACLLGVADVVEAMAAHRPYRPALGLEAGLDEIERRRGTQFAPEIVDACLRLFRERGFTLD